MAGGCSVEHLTTRAMPMSVKKPKSGALAGSRGLMLEDESEDADLKDRSLPIRQQGRRRQRPSSLAGARSSQQTQLDGFIPASLGPTILRLPSGRQPMCEYVRQLVLDGIKCSRGRSGQEAPSLLDLN